MKDDLKGLPTVIGVTIVLLVAGWLRVGEGVMRSAHPPRVVERAVCRYEQKPLAKWQARRCEKLKEVPRHGQ